MEIEIKVKEIMDNNPVVLSSGSTVQAAMEILCQSKASSLPVVDEYGCFVGNFTISGLYKILMDSKLAQDSLEKYIITNLECINENEEVSTILDKEEEDLPVINGCNKLVGIIKKSDALKMYYNELKYTVNSLNAMLGSATNGIVAIDKNEKIIIFNNAAEKMLGVSASKALGKDITDILPNSILPQVLKTGNGDINKTFSINRKALVTNRAPIVQEGEIVGAVTIFQDITDYKKALQELDDEKSSSYLLKTILERVYDGIVYVDKEGYIKLISKAYANFLGLDSEKVIGKHVTEVIENTRMHIVIKTGKAEVADIQKIKGSQMIATRIPIIKDGVVVGAVGKVLFRNVNELNSLYNKISNMEKELELYKGELKNINIAKYSFKNIIGNDKKMEEAKYFAQKASATNSNVLILGESGTGKELFAHAIHNASRRANGPFIKVNCAAIPDDLLESELFGYEGGAFTGAKKEGKIGKFKVADGGTMFLDEIGDIPLNMQVKLLRVLQEKEIERIGSNITEKIDVRIIAATNRDLEEMIKQDNFRSDLFYRLNVLTINIPTLRGRKDDIPVIANYLVDKISSQEGVYIERISNEAMEQLKKYNWPGNIRELENILERAINILDNDMVIRPQHLPSKITGNISKTEIKSLENILIDAEKQAIVDSLIINKNNKTKAADLLKISRSSLYEKMSKYNISVK